MKISYRNQAVLKMLSTGIMGPVAIHSQDKNELNDELLSEFGKLWKFNAASFNGNIKILSLPFAEAVIQSADKLITGDLLEKAFIESKCGTLIINDRTICYSFERTTEKVTELTFYLFQKSPRETPELKCFIYTEFDEQNLSANTHSYFAKSGVYKNDTSLSIEMCIKTLIATLNFIKYADIEVKLLPRE